MALLPLTTSANQGVAAPLVVNIRCPICRHQGAFHGRGDVHDISWNQPATEEDKAKNVVATLRAGVRLCPNKVCQAPVFVIMMGREVIKVYPPEVLDFDTTALPQHIASTLEESVKAHSVECFRASALMVRRVLEEVCKDKEAKGKDLKARVAALGGAALIPKELIEAADELRILGNDAAHVEAQAYDQIGKVEAEVAIDLAKEILKAVYQYSSLVNRLKSLKRPRAEDEG